LLKQAERDTNNADVIGMTGVALAGAGHAKEALEFGKRAIQLMPIGKDAIDGYRPLENMIQTYLYLGDIESAEKQLEYMLSIPGELGPGRIYLDPDYSVLLNSPRIKSILKKYSMK
jgi:hypothetical protein